MPHSFYLVLLLCVALSQQVRFRGNKQRNVLDTVAAELEINITATRGPGPLEGKQLLTTFSTDGFLWSHVRRLLPPDSPTHGLSGHDFRVGFLSVIEFRDNTTTSNGILDGDDTVVSQHALWGFQGRAFQPILADIGVEDDLRYHFFKAETVTRAQVSNDPSDPALLTFSAGISDMRGFVTTHNNTLAPDAWNIEMLLEGYPYKAPDTFLAVKCVIEGTENTEIVSAGEVPEQFRDDPFLMLNDVLVKFPSEEHSISNPDDNNGNTNNNQDNTDNDNENDNESGFALDQGYVSWEPYAKVWSLPDKDSHVGKGKPDIYPVLMSPFYSQADDFFPESEQTLAQMDQRGIPSPHKRWVVYFSVPNVQPHAMLWEVFVGLDEQDELSASSSATSLTACGFTVLLLLVSMLLL